MVVLATRPGYQNTFQGKMRPQKTTIPGQHLTLKKDQKQNTSTYKTHQILYYKLLNQHVVKLHLHTSLNIYKTHQKKIH